MKDKQRKNIVSLKWEDGGNCKYMYAYVFGCALVQPKQHNFFFFPYNQQQHTITQQTINTKQQHYQTRTYLPVHVLLEQVHGQVYLCLGSEPPNAEAQRRVRHLIVRACLVSIVWGDVGGKYCVTICASILGI